MVTNPRKTKNFLTFMHAGTWFKVSIKPKTLGHVVQYGEHTFSLPHPSWKIIGFSTHHQQNRPVISMAEAAKDPEKIIKTYVWDVDHGTIRSWGGQYHGKVPRVQYAHLENPRKGGKSRSKKSALTPALVVGGVLLALYLASKA